MGEVLLANGTDINSNIIFNSVCVYVCEYRYVQMPEIFWTSVSGNCELPKMGPRKQT